MGSEPGMGWKFINTLSKEHDLSVIVNAYYKDEIDRYLEENGIETNIKFYYLKRKKTPEFILKVYPPSYYWMYQEWHKRAGELAMELCKKEKFDIVHQLNMVGYREPGYFWKIKDVPFVWGPIGGFCITPWQMLAQMGLYGAVFYGLRNIINALQMRTSCRVKKAMRRADALIAATQDGKNTIKKLYNREATIIPEVGTVDNIPPLIKKRNNNEPLRICWCGQHTPGKSLNLLIEALSLYKGNYELHVIGDGRETTKWKKLATKLGVNNIIWYGKVLRSKALEITQNSHLFVITSMKDATSTVLLEALSFGLPVIAMDHCGFSNVINEKCGIKIPIKNKKQVVKQLAEAIEYYNNNEEVRYAAANNAVLRSKDYSWDGKVQQLNKIYAEAIKKFNKQA